MSRVMQGIVHGKTIELDRESGVPDGHAVEIVIRPISVLPEKETWGEGLRRSAGALAGIPGVDKDMDQILGDRKTASTIASAAAPSSIAAPSSACP
jgi:hypothetical protein